MTASGILYVLPMANGLFKTLALHILVFKLYRSLA